MNHICFFFRDSYLELMKLVKQINPRVKYIHHSEKNADDPEEKQKARRRAAAKAYKETFGRDCKWFMDESLNSETDTDNESEGEYLASESDMDSSTDAQSDDESLSSVYDTNNNDTENEDQQSGSQSDDTDSSDTVTEDESQVKFA